MRNQDLSHPAVQQIIAERGPNLSNAEMQEALFNLLRLQYQREATQRDLRAGRDSVNRRPNGPAMDTTSIAAREAALEQARRRHAEESFWALVGVLGAGTEALSELAMPQSGFMFGGLHAAAGDARSASASIAGSLVGSALHGVFGLLSGRLRATAGIAQRIIDEAAELGIGIENVTIRGSVARIRISQVFTLASDDLAIVGQLLRQQGIRRVVVDTGPVIARELADRYRRIAAAGGTVRGGRIRLVGETPSSIPGRQGEMIPTFEIEFTIP